QGSNAAVWAIGVSFVLANVHHQPRMECAAIQAVCQTQPDPVRMLPGDRVAAYKDLCLHRSGIVHQVNTSALELRQGRGCLRCRLLPFPTAEDFLRATEYGL